MDFSIAEILQNCSSFGKIESDFPIERFSCKVSIRVDSSLDDIDEVVCGILKSQGGEIESNLLGDILGLSVYDRHEEKKYRDQAEVDVLNQLLSGVEDFDLISIEEGTNPLVALTELGRESISTKIKYRYLNARFTDYSTDKIKGLSSNVIHSSFNISPELGDLQIIQSEKILPSCYLDKELFNSIQNSCSCVSGYDNAKLVSFNEPESYRNFNQSVTYKLFVHPTSFEEFVLVFKEDGLLNEISNAINDQQNGSIKSSIIRDIKFDNVWNNPDTLYGSDILNLYLDKWDWNKLLDKKIEWTDKLVWEILEDNGNATIWNKVSFIAPIENIIEQLTIRIEKWNWPLLSERLPDDVILFNIDNPFLRWDFEVLSLKSIEFIRAAFIKLRSYNLNNVDQQITANWNFYDVTDSLDDNFIIEAISEGAAINYLKLSNRPFSYVVHILELQDNSYNNWDYNYFSENWTIDQILQIEPFLGNYLNWYKILGRIAENNDFILKYLKTGDFNTIISKYGNTIKSFSDENLLWEEWLIDYFDQHSLINWLSTYSQKGFDCNEFFAWDENLLQKYKEKFSSSKGKSFFSGKIQSVEFIRKNRSFDFDWVAIIDNLDKNANLHKELTGSVLYEFKELLPWRELCSKIRSDSFILKGIPRFKEYFDFEILSGRSEKLVQQLLEIPELIEQNWNWEIVTQTVSDIFIIKNLKDFPWDFDVLSSKEVVFVEQAILSNNVFTLLWQWDTLADKLSVDFIKKILPILNNKYGSLQPFQIKQFWLSITPRLERDFLKSTASEYIFEWDWNYITKNLYTKEEVVENLDIDAGFWDWSYLLKEKFTSSELADLSLWIKIQRAKSLIKNDLKRLEITSLLTKKIIDKPDLLLYWMEKEKENPIGLIKMDWDLLSQHKQFYYTDNLLKEFIEYWNWDLISAHKNIFSLVDEEGQFQPSLRDSVKKRLENKKNKWNWKILSRNEGLIKNFNILSDRKFIRKWDWTYISEFGKFIGSNKEYDSVRHIYNRLQDFIEWELFSTRKDIHFTSDLLREFKDKRWNWAALSESNKLEIDNNLLIELHGKEWNWNSLSRNNFIDLRLPKTKDTQEDNPGLLISLIDKDWDWQALSERNDLEISYYLIKETLGKPWNFKVLTPLILNDELLQENYLKLLHDKELDWHFLSSTSKLRFTIPLIEEYKDKWDWDALTINKSLSLTRDLVIRFNTWNYEFLTKREEIIENVSWILEQKDKGWDWTYIAQSERYLLDDILIDGLSDKLDFSILSSNSTIKFTNSILKKYFKKWNYNLLESNYLIKRDPHLQKTLNEILQENPSLYFVQKIDSQHSKWKGFIYHFTHLTNAVDIINSQKILSRNSALKKGFSNAAGSVVDNRNDAHKFARFYFRPQTPTQFYNENLGKDSKSGRIGWKMNFFGGWEEIWKSYYPQAQRLGLPRCPVPVFFRFNMNEVLEEMESRCFISNGNLQTKWAELGPIKTMVGKFNFDDLYSSINNTSKNDWHDYKEFSQQEFLVLDEFDFSKLDSVEIIVPNEESKLSLVELLDFDNPLIKKIFINNYEYDLYHGDNSKVIVSLQNDNLQVTTDYHDKHSFEINFESTEKLNELNGDIIKILPAKIIAMNNFSAKIESSTHINIKFIDELYREWTIFSLNSQISNNQNQPFSIRLEKIFLKINKVKFYEWLDGFEDLEYSLKLRNGKALYSHRMINSNHGIAHTTRVVFWGYILSYIMDLSEELRKCIIYSCLIHDLGKQGDKDDEMHGSASAILYEQFLKTNIPDENLFQETYQAIKYHSVLDINCPEKIRNTTVYKVLKDADALDRGRFANPLYKYGCNLTFLRTSIFREDIAEDIIWIAYYLAQETKQCIWEKPYKEIIDIFKNFKKE